MPSLTKVQTGFLDPQGSIELNSGTASAPSLKFATSSATGIFSPSTGALGFSTGSTQNALTILSGGNVGIGVGNPSAKLHIDGSIHQTWSDCRLGIFYDNSYRQGLVYSTPERTLKIFSTTNDSGGNVAIYTRVGLGASDSDYGNERLRVTANGNIGIGITNPSYKLDILGDINFTGTFYQNGSPFVASRWTSGTGDNIYRLNGNVGIGITNPTSKLSVGSTGTDRISIDWIGGGGPYAVAAIQANMQTGEVRMGAVNSAGTHFATLYSNNSEAVRITSTGLVGINQPSPALRFSISEVGADITGGQAIFGTNMKGILLENSLNDNSSLGLWMSTGSHRAGISMQRSNYASTWGTDLRFYTHDDSSTNLEYAYERVRIGPNGNVGIGTVNPVYKLHVVGDINFTGSLYQNGSPFASASSTWDTGTGDNIYRLLGNIGIGTTNPSSKLDVVGSITASGSVSAAGASGFYSTTYASNARNPIWRFANADGYGLSYFQGSAGVSPAGGGDTIGFHFGTATAAASLLQLNNGSGAVINGTLGVTGQFQSTQANSTAIGGGQIYLNGAAGNRIDFNQAGVAAPAFTTRSTGTKIVLYPSLGASNVDYAFGIDNSTLWSSIPETASHQFKWYAGTTNIATLSGGGNLTVTGSIIATNFGDATGGYNVNLGSGGSEGRGLVAGYSGGSYGGIGYNVRHTTTGGQWIAPGSDTSSYLLFNSAGFTFYGEAGGAAGRTLSYTALATLSSGGNLVLAGGSPTANGNAIWHAGNDGAGSGLDADLWDGYQLSTQGNWSSNSAINIVTGLLAWKHYGNSHVIFDASNGTSPSGTSVNSTTPENLWTSTFPTLMGWNGANTYGVRVDSARISDSTSGSSTSLALTTAVINSSAWAGGSSYHGYTYSGGNYRFGFSSSSGVLDVYADGNFYATDSSHLVWHAGNATRASNSNLMYYQGFTLDANTMDTNSTGFTYAVNAPATGPVVRFSTGGGYDLWLNAPYNGGGTNLYFRTRNGDTGSFNSWHTIWNAGNDGAGSGLDADLLDGLNATSANTGSTVVARDSSGNFSAGTITATNFIDADNTTYNFNGSGTTRLNTLRIFSNASADWDAIQIATDGQSGYIQGLGDEIGLRIRSDLGNILLADDRGRVGIRTAAPLQTLDVRGNFLLAADSTTATHITQKPYTTNNGTLSWEGSAGQLFSITNNLTTGSIFSVNDISGIPSIDVDANGTIELAPFAGNVGVGTTNPATKLQVSGILGFFDQFSSANGCASIIRIGNCNTGGVLAEVLYSCGEESFTEFPHSNVFIGDNAGQGSQIVNAGSCQNVFIGHNAGRFNGAYDNVFLGNCVAVYSNNAHENVVIGSEAGFCMDEAGSNVYIGGRSGYLDSGYYNVFVGRSSGNAGFGDVTSTYENSFFGDTAGYNSAGSCQNVFMGTCAGFSSCDSISNVFVGYGSGRNSCSACQNVYIGERAGFCSLYGNNNIAIGTNAGATIGDYGATLTPSGLLSLNYASGKIVIGNSFTTNFHTKMADYGSGGAAVYWNSSTYELYSASSSARYKENIRPFLGGLQEILQMEPVAFTYIEQPDAPEQVGLIAEQLDDIQLTHFVNYNKESLPESVLYDRIVVLAINAIKELNAQNQTLQERIQTLENFTGFCTNN